MCWDVLAGMAALAAFFFWAFNKLDSDIKLLSAKLDANMNAQNARTDQLYTMFIDLLKAGKGKE